MTEKKKNAGPSKVLPPPNASDGPVDINAEIERAKLIRKIKALLKKTVKNGCTQKEADGAQEKAKDLMEANRITEEELKRGGRKPIPNDMDIRDIVCHLESFTFIYTRNYGMWPATSVNAHFGAGTADWIAQNQYVQQTTWAPGLPQIIEGRTIANGAWIDDPAARVFNLYRGPTITGGDPNNVKPWLDHLEKVFPYPGDAEHILRWFAWRVQHPEIKINHSLVFGGDPRIGKDTLIAGVRPAVGEWNVTDANPANLFDDFDAPFLRAVIMRVSEARDLGDVDRYKFYERCKTIMASPPETILVNDKHLKRQSIMNLVGPIITTNYKTSGMYLPADDGRHYVAWSPLTREDFNEVYFKDLWTWYKAEGFANVAAHLRALDLSKLADFPHDPPPKTAAFWEIVGANRSTEDQELVDLLEWIGWPDDLPDAVTIRLLAEAATEKAQFAEFGDWIKNREGRRKIGGRLERAGYMRVINPDTKDGRHRLNGTQMRFEVYALKKLNVSQQLTAATKLIAELKTATLKKAPAGYDPAEFSSE